MAKYARSGPHNHSRGRRRGACADSRASLGSRLRARRHHPANRCGAQAALARLDELASQDEVSQESAQHLRKHYEARVSSITKRFKQAADKPGEEHAMTYHQLQRGALQAARSAVIGLRNQGEINDEVLRRIERELDLEEQQLAGEAGKS